MKRVIKATISFENIPRFALIDLYDTAPSGPIKVAAVSDSVEALEDRLEAGCEIVRVFESDGQIYYSRDLDKLVETFKGNADELLSAIAGR